MVCEAIKTANEAGLRHVTEQHNQADGWITLAKRTPSGEWQQRHYRAGEFAQELSEWTGEDVYFSQNTFYRPIRRIENIRQLRSLYVDVDCYLFNLYPEWILRQLEDDVFRHAVPDPNLVIFSGRGLALVWFLEPVPAQALPLWQAVENHFIRECETFGSDTRSSDPARVLRLAGTINSKSHQTVTVQYRHDYRYTLRDLQYEYLPELKRPQKKATQPTKKVERLFNVYSLHHARLLDLVQLCELRGWEMRGHRETALFLYRYWATCFLGDPEQALQDVLDINSQFAQPLKETEVVRATQSAEKAYYARSDAEANRLAKEHGYPGAGYNISNRKLIEWLDITESEQRQLKTIIGRRVKYDRSNQTRQEARRAAGKATRDEYLTQAQKRRQEAIRMRQEGMTYKAIAKSMGISVSAVNHLINDWK